MSNQSIINPDNSKSYLDGIIDVTKLKTNTEPFYLKESFAGSKNKYDRNLAEAMNDPMGQRTQQQNRLINQPTSEAFYNAGIQAASEIGLGTLEGAGFLLDIPQWVNTIKGTERDFGNWFSDSINELKKEVAEDNPIYAVDGYHPTNAKWWASMIPSIATSASLMIPSMGGAKLMSTVGKLSTKLAKGIASNSKSANLLAKGLEKSGAALQNYTGVSAAVFSRMAEGTLEATEAGTQAYQKYIEQGMSMEEATEKAGQASAATFLGNMPLLALDLLQYNSIFKQFNTRVGIQAAENALDLSTKSLARRTLQKAWNTVKVPLGEGAEEGLQFGVKEESIKMAQEGMPDNRIETIMKQYSDIAKNLLPEYFDNDEFLTSITLGAVGGKVFDTITPAVRRLAKMDNTVDEDLRSGKIIAPYYKTRKAFVDLLQQDEVKANEMLEAAKTDPKLNKLGELYSFENLLTTYNELKADEELMKNPNAGLLIKTELESKLYTDLVKQLEEKNIEIPEGIEDYDLKLDALNQLESYELQSPTTSPRNLQFIKTRRNEVLAEKLEKEKNLDIKPTYKPKEGYSWGSRTHRNAINHHANIEMAKILASISNLKYQTYLSENGSMYADLDAKLEKSLENIEDLKLLRGSEEFDTDEKYLNFLLDLKTKRTDLTEEVNLILDDIYKENISDETHPINKVVLNQITNSVDDKVFLNDLARIDEINRNSPKFRNLFSHGVSTNFLVSPNTSKYTTEPVIGSVVKINNNEFLLYKKEDNKGFFKSLTDETDNFELELSDVKPTDIVKSYRIVRDFESNSNLILLEDKAVIVNDGTTVYERNNPEGIVRHDLLSELSYPEIYILENNRRKELEKVDVKIPALKTIGNPINVTPFTLGNKSKASRKNAARNLNLKEGDLVKLWFYEKDSKTPHAIPFVFTKGELIDTTNPYYNPKFDDRIFVKAQKYETQIDYNNEQYNAINDKYNFKYIELLEEGKLSPSQVYTILKNKNVEDNIDLWEAYYNVTTTKFKINSDQDIDNILNVLKHKGYTIKKRGDSRLDGSKIEKGYEINGEPFKSVTELIEIISPYDKLNKTFQGAINAGNFIDELSREIFTSDEINRVLLTNKYKSKFADVNTLNDAINLIATNKLNLQKKGFKFVTSNVVLFDKSSGKNVAGEIDLLAYDNLGNIHIMDFKTFTDNSYLNYSDKKESKENLTKRDRYRIQLSTYAELFKNLTGYKISGINIIPYVLNYDAETGIIDSITSKSIDDFKVISKINPISFRNESFNSSYELLKIMEKTDDAIITKSNLSKVFSSSNKSLKNKIQYLDSKTFIPKENTLNIEHVITHINDFLTKFNGYRSLLSKEELDTINNYNDIVNKLISLNNFTNEKIVVTSGITGFESYVKGEQEINLSYTFQKLPEMLVTISNNKVYELIFQDIRYSLKKEVDLATDNFLFIINNNNYVLTPEEYKKLIDEDYSRETLTEEILQPYLVTDLMEDAIYYDYNINEFTDEIDSDVLDIEDLQDIIKTNKKILTIESTKDAIDSIQENNIIDYKVLLEKYFADNNEESLLENLLELEKILQNSLNDIVTQLDSINPEDELYADLISKMNILDDLINTIKNFTTNLETFIVNEDETIVQEDIDNMLDNLLNKLDIIEINTPISDEDLQDLKDIADTVIKPIQLPDIKKTVKQNRTLKNKYKNKFIYITKDAVKDLFSKVSSDYIVNADKLFEEYLSSNNILPENITSNTYSNFKKLLPKDKTYITTDIEFISISDNIIYYSIPPAKDTKFYKRELGLIESNLKYGGEEEVRKIDLLRPKDNVINLLTTGNKIISDDTINEARELYSFNYDGVELDENVPYNPFIGTTLVTRSDFYNTERSELANKKDKFYGRKTFIPTDESDVLRNILPDLFNGKVVEIDNLPVIKSSNVVEDFENLYNKKKQNLLKEKVSVLVRKTASNNYIIVFANKEYINNSVKFTPIGIMNTLEQAVYAYDKTKDKKESVFLTKLIREDIESLASNNPIGELIEVNYDKINLLDVRSTGLNKLDNPKPVYDVLKDKNNPQLIIHINGKFFSNLNIPNNLKENLKNTYNLKENNSLNIFYNTTDKLGKQVSLGSTLKFYKNAHDDYKISVERLIKSIINNRDKNDIKSLKSDILELGKGYVYTKLNEKNSDGDFLQYANNFNDINEFNNFYDPEGKMTMRIDFVKLQNDNSYAINVAKNYLTTTIDTEPYANIQYFFGIINNTKNTTELDESIEFEEEVIDETIEEEFEDEVIVNTNIVLNDEGSFKINKPTSLKYYLQQLGKGSPFTNELSNSYNGNESILKGFNELLTDLNSLDSVNSLSNVINHILKYTNNTSLKNINKTIADIVADYDNVKDNKINTLRNYVDSFKEYVIDNQQNVIDFYTEAVDNSYYIENNVEMSIHELRKASEALLSLSIQNGLDFRDFENIKKIVKGSSFTNFFLNDLVTLLLKKANNSNISIITKIVKALRKDITTIELSENNEIVLIRNEVNYRKPTGGILYNQILKSLKVYGYDVEVNTVNYEEDYEDDIPNLEEIVDNNESWSELIKFQFPTTNLSRNVKVLLQSIESPEVDKLGLNINLNYPLNMAYGIVMDKLVNSIDVNDVKNKLQNEFNDIPYIKRLNSHILNQENPEELYSQIYTSIGNKIRVTYETVIKDRTGKIYGSLSNRQSYEFIISERLNSDVKNNVKHTPRSILDTLNLYEKDINSILSNEIAVKNIETLIDVYEKGLEYYNSLKTKNEKDLFTFTLKYSYNKEIVNVSSLIKDAIKYIPKSGNTYHMTVKDKIQYQDTNSNFLGYIQNNSKKYYEMLSKDKSFANLPVVQRKNPIDVIQVIGYDDQKGNIGYEIGKLNSKLATEMMLVMHKRNAYPIAVPGDSGNALYVKGLMPKEKTKTDIYNELYELMVFEKNRVDGNEESLVKVYNKKKSDYIIFNKVNSYLKDNNLSFNKSNVLTAFDNFFEENYVEYINYLKELQIIDNKGRFISNLQGYTKNNYEKDIREFLLSYALGVTNILLLTNNDLAYYKSIEDIFKRGKQVVSSGERINTLNTYTDINTKEVVTIPEKIKILIYEDVKDEFKDSEEYKNIAKALNSTNLNNKENIISEFDRTSLTDGQSYIDLISYRQRMIALSLWSDTQQDMMNELMKGGSISAYNKKRKLTSKDSPFNVIKPFFFANTSAIKRDAFDNQDKVQPFQKKDSEFIITPNYGLKKVNSENGLIVNPLYNKFFRDLLEKMGYVFNDTTNEVSFDESKRTIDMASSNEAIKVGESNTVKPDNLKDGAIEIPFEFWMKQNETPKGHFSKDSIFGTQIMKIITSNISDDAKFTIGNEVYTKKELVQQYDYLLMEDLKYSYEELKNRFKRNKNDNNVSFEMLVNHLKEIFADDTLNLQKALEFIVENDEISTTLPLSHPILTAKVQPKLNAEYRNSVTVRRFKKGFKAANVSPYGFENKPRIVWNTNKDGVEDPTLGIKHFEVIAPIHDKRIYQFVDEISGLVDMKELEKTYPELLDGVLYRIPTEDLYSIFKVKIIGFLTDDMGAVIMPSSLTTLSGLDFDIDKMFGFFKDVIPTIETYEYIYEELVDLKSVHSSQIKEITDVYGDEFKDYPKEIKDKKAQIDAEYKAAKNVIINSNKFKESYELYIKMAKSDNAKLDIMMAVLSNKDSLKTQLNPGGFKVIEEAVLDYKFYDLYDQNGNPPIEEEQYNKKDNSAKSNYLSNKSYSFLSPILINEVQIAMNVGKDMTGIAANHNAARTIMQRSGIKFNNKLKVLFDGVPQKLDINNIRDFKGNIITKSMSTVLASVLDNGKNPLIKYFGLSLDNYNVPDKYDENEQISTSVPNTFLAVLHLGYPIEMAMTFNKAFTNLLKNSILTKEEKKAIEIDIFDSEESVIDLNTNDLITYLKHYNFIKAEKREKELVDIEKKLYRNFILLSQIGYDINKIVTYTQRGNRGAKSTYFENHLDILDYKTYLSDEINYARNFFDVKTLKEYFSEKSNTFINDFNNFIETQFNDINTYLSFPDISSSDRKSITSIASLIESNEYFRRKDDKLLKKIYNAIYYKATLDSYPDYFAEKIDTIDKYLTKNTWDKIKKKYKNNNFIKSLKLDNTYEGEGIKLIINTDFKDIYKNDELTDEWSKLMFSLDKQDREVGELLAVYSLYTSGYDIGFGTFNQLVPIEFYSKVLPNYSKTLMNTIKQMLKDPEAGLDIFAMVMHKHKGLSRFVNKNNVSAEYNSSVTFKDNVIIDNVLNSTNTVYYKLSDELFSKYDINYDDINHVKILDDSLGDMPSFSDELNPEVQIVSNSIISNSELISDINSSVFNNKDLDIRSGSVVLYDNERFIVRGIDNNEAILFSIADNTNYKYKIPINELRVLGSYNSILYNKSTVILINNDTDILSLTTGKIVYKNDTSDRRNIINAIMSTGTKKNEATVNNKVIIEKPLNGVELIKDSKLSLELSNEFIDILSPVITKSAERENASSDANYMFSFGKRWTRLKAVRGYWKTKFDTLFKSNNAEFIKEFNEAENLPNNYTKFQAWKNLLNKWIGTKFDLTITPHNKGWNGSGYNYAYSDLDAYGNPVESMNTLAPITKYIESKLGIDLSGYNSVLANIYTETQFIPPHRDTTEDVNAEGYAIVVLNIGADGSISEVTSNTSLPITNGGIYAFGVDGVDRFKFYHKIDVRDFGRVTPTKPITLPDGTTLENYRITLTYRRVTNPKNDNLSDKPRRIPTESEIIDVMDSIKESEQQIIVDETKPEFNKLPNKSTTPTMTYAGIGSRETPQEVLDKMTEVAKYLEGLGYTLRSGGAVGADKAFEKGVTSKKEVFLGTDKTGEREKKIAREIHPNPQALDNAKSKTGKPIANFMWNLMGRNTNQIFGANLDTPVDFVLAWTQDGLTDYRNRSIQSGGTGQAIDMASRKGIPVINMANDNWRDELKKVINFKSQPSTNVESKRTFKDEEYHQAYIKGGLAAVQELIQKNKQKEMSAAKQLSKEVDMLTEFENLNTKPNKTNSENDRLIELYTMLKNSKELDFEYSLNQLGLSTQQPETQTGINIKPIVKDLSRWSDIKNATTPYTNEGIVVTRISGTEEHFGNPFIGSKRRDNNGNLIESKVDNITIFNTIDEADQAYRDWLEGIKHQNVEPLRREWILKQINEGKLDGKILLYYKPMEVINNNGTIVKGGYHSHADSLSEIVEKLRTNQPTTPSQTNQSTLFNANDKTLKKGSVVKYNNEIYLFWNKTDLNKAQLIKIDGTKFSGTPNIDKLEVLGNYKTTIYNNVEYIVTDKNNIYSGATGNLVYTGTDNSSITQKENIIRQAKTQPKYTSVQVDIEVPELKTIMLEKDLYSYSIDELNNIAKQLRQKAVNAREAEREGKTILGGSQIIEDDYQALKKYIREKESLQQSETPAIKVDKTLITEEPIVNEKPSTITTLDRKIEVDIDTYLKNKNSKLNDDQIKTMKLVYDRFKTKSSKMVVINGKAGTGKTFMLKELLSYINSTVDKNSKVSVLGSSVANNIKNNLKTVIQDNNNSNIIYGFQSVNSILGIADDKRIKTKTNKTQKERQLPKNGILLVDEASMINIEDFKALERKAKHSNTFIIYVGDSGQLFPVHGNTMPVFSLIPKSDQFELTKAMRQKPNSLILQYSNQFWNKAHNINTKEIAIPNRINKDGGVVEITTVNSDNVFEVFKYAVDNKKLDYIRYITAKNDDVDTFNTNIHNKLFPNEEYGNGEFMTFNSNYKAEYKDIKISIDNATKFIVKEKLSDFQITLIPELVTEINIGNFKFDKSELQYNYYNVMVGNIQYVLPILTINSYKKLNDALKSLNESEYDKNELDIILKFIDQFPDVSYDYANTLHKAQGLTFDIVIYDKTGTDWLKSKGISGQDNAFYTATTRPKNLLLITGGLGYKSGPNAIPTKDLGSIVEINSNITNNTQEDKTFSKSKPSERRTSTETKTKPTETQTTSSGLEMGNVYNYEGVDYVYLFDVEGVSYYIDTVENDTVEDLPTNLPIKKQFKTVVGDNNFIYINNTDKKFIYIYRGKLGVKLITEPKEYEFYLCNKF